VLGTPAGGFSGVFLTRFRVSAGEGIGAGVESDPSAVRIRSVGEAARGGKTFLSRGGPEDGLPTLLLGVILRSPSRGVNGREPDLGVKLRVPVLGVMLRAPVLGVMLREPVLGAILRGPVLGVILRAPVLGGKLREPLRGVAVRGPPRKPSRGFARRGRMAGDAGPSFLAGRSVRFTNFDRVEGARFAL
jgi:hypothetical protein